MTSYRFIHYIAGSKNKLPTVYLQCRVKPGASKVREGVTSLTDDAVELCVAAAAREGEANKAVLAVLSEVSFLQWVQHPSKVCCCSPGLFWKRSGGGMDCADGYMKALGVPKSDLRITRGTKSRDKTVAIGGKVVQSGEECLGTMLKSLGEAVEGTE